MRVTDGVSRETSERLTTYLDMLRRWNARIQLTRLDLSAASGPIDDSLQLRRYIRPGVSDALDIGSGNGLPAVPLSIAFGIPYTLVESDLRKAAFLREVAREVACPVTVVAQRIEDMPGHQYDLITARAFAPLDKLMVLAYPRQAVGAVCLFPKGRSARAELEEARRHWRFECVAEPAGAGSVLRIHSIQPRA